MFLCLPQNIMLSGIKMDKKQIKKIILSSWFWVIVAIISYFIFVSIPIQWTGEGLEEVEGTGGLKTFFAYLTSFSWIIAISLLIFSGIKAIQKSKIGDYWKVSFTILGIILIIAFVFYSVKDYSIFSNLSNKYDERIGDLDNEKEIKLHISLLEDDGYEVEYFYYALENTEFAGGSLNMKSLGNQKLQVQKGLFAVAQVYPDAPKYYIKILEPTRECNYEIDGDKHRAYRKALQETDFEEAINNPEEYAKSDAYLLGLYMDYQIENPYCQ